MANMPGQSKSKKGVVEDSYPVVPHKDLFHRVNFSYQAAIFLQSLGQDTRQASVASEAGPSRTTTTLKEVGVKGDRKGKRKAVEVNAVDHPEQPVALGLQNRKAFRRLARLGMRETKSMGVHTQLKLDPSMKRSICRACSTVLIPGLTSRVRNRPNTNSFSISHHTCLACQTSLSIPSRPIASERGSGDRSHAELSITLDGPVRAARRRRAAKRTRGVFHELEKGDEGGHVLWRGADKVTGWGVGGSTADRTSPVVGQEAE
ncbi:hypothetical protein IAU60_000722 [Kwoniella sp. DSM 27419]